MAFLFGVAFCYLLWNLVAYFLDIGKYYVQFLYSSSSIPSCSSLRGQQGWEKWEEEEEDYVF